jgi:predicted TPR repeat methyltransferase
MNDAFERARTLFVQGMQAFEAGRLAEAEAQLAASLQQLPGRPSTLLNLAVVRTRLRRPAEALPLLQEVLAQEPANADAWGHHGTALAALGRLADAVASFEKALAIAPTQPAALFLCASQLNALGRHAEALTRLDALLALRPDDAEALFERGLSLQALARPVDALASYERLLALRPQDALAWTQRGAILKDLGRLAEAAESFRRALALGGDAELNRYLLASVDAALPDGGTPSTAPRAYVEGLFDQYAATFDEHLVSRLGYRTPELLASLLPAGRRFDAALDLGCGTGLMAPLLRPRAEAIDGVDLSRQMLEKARALGIYRALHHADVTEFLGRAEGRYGLVVAADVFVYVGALDAVFEGVARVLAPEGLFLFSVEEAADGRELELRTTSRYAHGLGGLRRLAGLNGLTELRVERATLRHDQGRPITGLCVLLQRDGVQRPGS